MNYDGSIAIDYGRKSRNACNSGEQEYQSLHLGIGVLRRGMLAVVPAEACLARLTLSNMRDVETLSIKPNTWHGANCVRGIERSTILESGGSVHAWLQSNLGPDRKLDHFHGRGLKTLPEFRQLFRQIVCRNMGNSISSYRASYVNFLIRYVGIYSTPPVRAEVIQRRTCGA